MPQLQLQQQNKQEGTPESQENISICNRLQWVHFRGLLWPAIQYDSYGQVLAKFGHRLDVRTKVSLSLKAFQCKNQTKVARLIGVAPFSVVPSEKSLDFYCHLGHAMEQATKKRYREHHDAFQRAMNETEAYMTNGLNEGQKEEEYFNDQDMMDHDDDNESMVSHDDPDSPVVPETPVSTLSSLSRESSCSHDIVGTPIYRNDSWADVWDKMRHSGWVWRAGANQGGNSVYYVKPGAGVTGGIEGHDYFRSPTHVQEYARRNYGWEGEEQELSAAKSTKRKSEKRIWGRAKKSKKRRESSKSFELDERQEDESPESIQSRPGVTPDHKTKPQDPGVPLLSASEDESQASSDRNRYEWVVLWPRLKKSGWTYVRASNPLHDWYYVRPGRSAKGGTVGVDYFLSSEDVIMHEIREDEKDSKSHRRGSSPLGLELEQEVVSAPLPEKSSIVRHERYSVKTHWWKKDAVPDFAKEIWPMLRDKLGIDYRGGSYIFQGDSAKFTSDYQLRNYMCKHGIPDCTRWLTPEEQQELTRWVSFANVPVASQNTVSRLESVPLLSPDGAWEILSKTLGYKMVNGQFATPYAQHDVTRSQFFDTMEELRVFLRSSETLDGSHEIEGLTRSQKRKVPGGLKDANMLALRVWAAMAPTPIPVHPNSLEEKEQQGDNDTALNEEEVPPPVTPHPNSLEEKEQQDDNETALNDQKPLTGTAEKESPDLREVVEDTPKEGASVEQEDAVPPPVTPHSSTMGIRYDDQWNEVWDKMMKNGWKRQMEFFKYFYYAPGGKHAKRGGQLNVDFFKDLDCVKQHAMEHYGWGGESS